MASRRNRRLALMILIGGSTTLLLTSCAALTPSAKPVEDDPLTKIERTIFRYGIVREKNESERLIQNPRRY